VVNILVPVEVKVKVCEQLNWACVNLIARESNNKSNMHC